MVESKNTSRRSPPALRIGLSSCLLLAILWKIDTGAAGEIVAQTNVPLLFLAALIFLLIRTITALRWFILLRVYGVEIGYLAVLRITFISTAIGQFIPGGADAASIYQVFKGGGKLSEISTAALLDRLFGISAMLAIATVAILVVVDDSQLQDLALTLIIGSIVALAFAIVLMRSGLLQRLLRDRPGSRLRQLTAGLRRAIELLSDSSKFGSIVFPSALTSILVQVLRVGAFFAVYASLGQEIGLGYFFAFVPLVFLAIAVPISVGGFGVREASLALLFSTAGVAAEVSVAAGLLIPLLQVAGVLPGLILIALGRFPSTGNFGQDRTR